PSLLSAQSALSSQRQRTAAFLSVTLTAPRSWRRSQRWSNGRSAMTSRSPRSVRAVACLAASLAILAGQASADNLLGNGKRANIASDLKSMEVGEILTVVVVQRAEARNSQDNVARRDRAVSGNLSTDALNQTADLSLNGDYNGHGEIRRSESFVTQIS